MNLLGESPYATCISRDIAKTDSTTLSFSDHYLAYCASGSMRLEIESRYFYLQPTKAVWIPAGKQVIAQIPTSITCCSILFNPASFPEHNSFVKTIELTPLARHMILYCRRWGAEGGIIDQTAESFYKALASVIVERMDAPTTDWIPRGKSTLVSRAVDLTIERHTRTIELAEIASELAASERTLSRRVVEETGLRWSELLRRVRMIAARELLTGSELQITAVANAVGYSSQSAFNKAFKIESGLAPRKFREQLKFDHCTNIRDAPDY